MQASDPEAVRGYSIKLPGKESSLHEVESVCILDELFELLNLAECPEAPVQALIDTLPSSLQKGGSTKWVSMSVGLRAKSRSAASLLVSELNALSWFG